MTDLPDKPRDLDSGARLIITETQGANVSGFMESFRQMLALMARLGAAHLDGRGVAVVFNADGEGEAGSSLLYGPPSQVRRLIRELTALADRAELEAEGREGGSA